MLLAGLAGQREDLLQFFQDAGIDKSRLEFSGYEPRENYLRRYDQIDICLDPLPYNGITTTGDALFMGVPVITLVGNRAAGRAGQGMLSALGLHELIANTPEQLIQLAASLAADRPRLRELRSTLRQRYQSSPLANFSLYARHLESAYREMWQNLR